MLAKMSRLSPLAGQYYQILTSFYEAIKGYWEGTAREAPPRTTPYVVRILSPGEGGGATHDPLVDSQYPTPGATASEVIAEGMPITDDFDMGDHFHLEPDISYTDGLAMYDAPLNVVWSDVIDFMEAFTPNVDAYAAM